MDIPAQMLQCIKYGLGMLLVWTGILAAMLAFIIHEYRNDTIKEATRKARDYHELIFITANGVPWLAVCMSPLTRLHPTPTS